MSWPASGKHQALEDDLEVEDEEPPRWEGKDLTEFRLG